MKLFVYGTLQPGQGLFGWLRDALIGEPERATTPGTLWHVGSGTDAAPVFPVAFIGPEEPEEGPQVWGTVLDLDDNHDQVQRTINMEQGAGYRMVTVECTLATGRTVTAFGFRYTRSPGQRIESGDWLEAIANARPFWSEEPWVEEEDWPEDEDWEEDPELNIPTTGGN